MDNNNGIVIIVILLIILVVVWLIINNPFFGIPHFLQLQDWQLHPTIWNSVFKKGMIPKSEYTAEDVVGDKAMKYRSQVPETKKEKQIVYATEEVMDPINETLIKPNTCGCTTCVNGQYVPQQELSDEQIQQNDVKPEGEFKHMSDVAFNNNTMWRHPQGSRRRFSYIEATNQTICDIKGKPTYSGSCKTCGNGDLSNLPNKSMFDHDKFYGFDRVAPFTGYGNSKNGDLLVDDGGKLVKKGNYDMWKKGSDGKVYKASIKGNNLSYIPLTDCKLYD